MDEQLLGGRYRRDRQLGRGAMGEVWLCEDTLLHRRVAVKSIAEWVRAEDAVDLDRMIREAQLAARLNHPHAVAVYDLVIEQGRPNLVMEYVAGQSLADELAAAGGHGLPPQRVASLGADIADALAEAHRIGIVHRDVKPANILLTERGTPKLADFGIARVSEDVNTTSTGLLLGTPAYVAPEVARGAPADPHSDIWSLGITLWTLLEGRSPFQRPGDTALTVLTRVVTEPVPRPRHDTPVAAAVMRLLAANPQARPSAAAAAHLLRGGSIGPPPGPGFTAPPQPLQPPRAALPQRAGPPSSAPYRDAPTIHGRTAPVPVPTPPPPRRPRTAYALVGAFVLAALVAGAIVWLARGSGAPGGGGTSGVAGSPPAAAPPTGSPTGSSASVSSPSSSSVATPSGPVARTAPVSSYAAPGGISVQAPAGYREDDSAGIANVRDYLSPGTGDRYNATYFRIGIGNAKPKPTIQAEAHATINYLEGPKSPYQAQVVNTTYTRFVGVPAVDLEFVGTDAKGNPRHAISRLFIDRGVTLEIEVNAPDDEWESARQLFTQLTTGCRVS